MFPVPKIGHHSSPFAVFLVQRRVGWAAPLNVSCPRGESPGLLFVTVPGGVLMPLTSVWLQEP